jgi:hypothetical protein
MRKLKHFGSSVEAADFEWPKQEDMLRMPAGKPIRVVGFNWKKSDSDGKAIAGVQVILANGVTSPLFLARGATSENIERVNITADQRIKRIKGQQGAHSNFNEVYFYDSNNNLITQMVASKSGQYDTLVLEDGDEILGVYGTKNKLYDNLDTLGFIVWKPAGNN